VLCSIRSSSCLQWCLIPKGMTLRGSYQMNPLLNCGRMVINISLLGNRVRKSIPLYSSVMKHLIKNSLIWLIWLCLLGISLPWDRMKCRSNDKTMLNNLRWDSRRLDSLICQSNDSRMKCHRNEDQYNLSREHKECYFKITKKIDRPTSYKFKIKGSRLRVL
jgi:hypothetical protein